MSKEPKKKKVPGKVGKIIKTALSSIAILLFVLIFVVANTVLPTYGRMINEILAYRQGWKTPATSLDLEYNKADFTAADAKSVGQALNEEIVGEGIVLLQNDGVLPLAGGTSLSLFSHSSVDVLAGGSPGRSGG